MARGYSRRSSEPFFSSGGAWRTDESNSCSGLERNDFGSARKQWKCADVFQLCEYTMRIATVDGMCTRVNLGSRFITRPDFRAKDECAQQRSASFAWCWNEALLHHGAAAPRRTRSSAD